MTTDRNRGSELPAGQVLHLVELATYAEGSIVSRVLVKGEMGTLTLFAFDAGQSLSEHTAPFDALVHVVDGEGQFTVDGQEFRVPAGDVLLMPANIPHAVHARQRFKMVLSMLRPRKT